MKKKRPRKPESYIERIYRSVSGTENLRSTLVRIKETDLQIFTDEDVAELAGDLALQYRTQVETYIAKRPEFENALVPLAEDRLAPPIVKDMLLAGEKTGIGPMAAVAGSIAHYVGTALLKMGCREVMVENGGDIFLHRQSDVTVAIFAGESPLSMRVGIKVPVEKMPLGICTSSGTVGHSLSFGIADSVTVLSPSTPLADAAATRLGNEVGRDRGEGDGIRRALEVGQSMTGLYGVVVVCGEKLGAVGDIELIKLD